jgi:hypothetical protein
MSIQVHDGGLPTAPVYDVPQYPHQGFDCGSTNQLVDIVQQLGLPISSVAQEYYVDHSLFSVALFNHHNEEIASFSVIMKRGQFHAKPDGSGRQWGELAFKANRPLNIGHLLGY